MKPNANPVISPNCESTEIVQYYKIVILKIGHFFMAEGMAFYEVDKYKKQVLIIHLALSDQRFL
jgi:hypothetical protein